MFYTIYKSTIKNLFRSVTFWLFFSIVIIVAVQNAMAGCHSYYDFALQESIQDIDPRYVLEYRTYVQWINNSTTLLLHYIVPLFTVAATVIILARDYGDQFFEIEKAGGLKPSNYLFGKLAAVITVMYVLSLAANFLETLLYVFTRRGVNGVSNWDTMVDCSVRLLRIGFFRILPCIIFFVCTTYFIGTLSKSKVTAAVCGMGYTVFCYAYSIFSVQKSGIFVNYLIHNPMRLRNFFHYYDTEWFEAMVTRQNTSISAVAVCISFLVGVGIVCSTVSCLRIRKRTV